MSEAEAGPQAAAGENGYQRNKAHHALAQWGNYHNYYFHRPVAAGQEPEVLLDSRLVQLPSSLFKDQSVLDLGCNAGKVTRECVGLLGARAAFGVDLDPWLVNEARKNSDQLDKNLHFHHANFMQPSPSAFFQAETFLALPGAFRPTLILLLSTTKWLHLHTSDAAMVELFESLFALLQPGGRMVLEPQDWDNYVKAARKNTALKPGLRRIELKPPFEGVLGGIGWIKEGEYGGLDERKHFKRDIWVWRKPADA